MTHSREKTLVSKLVHINQLLDHYGDLLTDKQRDFMRMHYEEDLSFGEIAEKFSISRQAVHDSVKHAERALRKLESKLHLLEQSSDSCESDNGPDRLASVLSSLKDAIQRRGVVYETDWIVEEIDQALECLEDSKTEKVGNES